MSQPVTVALRAYVASEANRTTATTTPPKKSPSRRTDSGVASTTVPDSRRVAWETASLRKRSLMGRAPAGWEWPILRVRWALDQLLSVTCRFQVGRTIRRDAEDH